MIMAERVRERDGENGEKSFFRFFVDFFRRRRGAYTHTHRRAHTHTHSHTGKARTSEHRAISSFRLPFDARAQ